MGFPRQEYWSGLPLPFPGELPHVGMEPTSPAFADGFFASETPGKPRYPQFSLQQLSPVSVSPSIMLFSHFLFGLVLYYQLDCKLCEGRCLLLPLYLPWDLAHSRYSSKTSNQMDRDPVRHHLLNKSRLWVVPFSHPPAYTHTHTHTNTPHTHSLQNLITTSLKTY